MMQPLWRGIWQYLAKLHTPLPFDPTISGLGPNPKIYLEKNKMMYVQGYLL